MDEYSFKGNEILYPNAEDRPKANYYANLSDETRQYMDRLWQEVKLAK